jgi:haloacetate dehalogenase
MSELFPGFDLRHVDTAEATIRLRIGGSGPPLLLLHGHPQTHYMWHKVAPQLAQHFTVVASDLRGYGQSSKPPTTDDHEPYSKRAMARDQVEVMDALGFDLFFVCGHDRGGRCAYRLALDFPSKVRKLAVLDIIPTAEMWARMDRELGAGELALVLSRSTIRPTRATHWFRPGQLLLPIEPRHVPSRGAGGLPSVGA